MAGKTISANEADSKMSNYGKPTEGSRTEFRGLVADVRISSEIVELCDIIRDIGTVQDDGSVAVTFGTLFDMYTKISNKVVGILLRARKHGLVTFEGEMLFQGRDEKKVIRLVCAPNSLEQSIGQRQKQLDNHPGNVGKQSHCSFR